MKKLFFSLFLCCGIGLARPATARPLRVILITIDGMRADVLQDSLQPVPFLHEMMASPYGHHLPVLQNVFPSMTYPSHTSIITGVTPKAHGIHCNRVFSFNKDVPTAYHFYADSIQVPTLWQRVKEHGGTTASIFWPVSVGEKHIDYNIPEYFSTTPTPLQALPFISPVCTPKGFLQEIEREATGRLNDTTMRAGSYLYEAQVAHMANYIENRYRPTLLTIHLITTDYRQHSTGLYSPATRQAYSGADHAVGLILENLRYTHQADSVAIIVMGDHGFSEGNGRLHPNTWLVANGLLSQDPGGKWQAMFHSVGASAYLYLNPELRPTERARTMGRIEKMLKTQPDSLRALFHIVTTDTIQARGGDPSAALLLEAAPHYGMSNNRQGPAYTPFKGGFHGYTSNCDPTGLLLYLEAPLPITAPSLPFSLTDVAPLILSLLDIQ